MKNFFNQISNPKMQANFDFCYFSINGSQLGGDIYAVPTIQSNILGEVVSATIGGGMENETGANVVPLGGMRMDTWPYDSPVTTDFHLDDSNWDSK